MCLLLSGREVGGELHQQAAVFRDVIQDSDPFFFLLTHPLRCDPRLPGGSLSAIGRALLQPAKEAREKSGEQFSFREQWCVPFQLSFLQRTTEASGKVSYLHGRGSQ